MRALLIDDSDLFHKILKQTIDTGDVVFDACNSITEALVLLKSKQFDFVCVSMHLKDGTGVKFAQEVRQIKSYMHIPVVLFTSEESKTLYIAALASGVTEVFLKKDVDELTNYIKRLSQQQKTLSGQVLYVEDTKSQRDVVVTLFREHGLTVDSFASAEAAWEAYKRRDYDLVVTDIVLEGSMTGKTLINYIRRINGPKGDIPILALTGFDDISRRIDLFYLGVTDYVIKPLIEEELMARVGNLIRVQQLNSESLKQRKMAENANKAKSEFITQMSHEMRTPLNAILGYAQILEMEDVPPDIDEYRHCAEEIHRAGKHLLGLINEVLDIAKVEAGHLELDLGRVDLSGLVRDCISLVMPLAEVRGIEISCGEFSGQCLYADKSRLKQVLLNLLSNAIKYNREEGKVEVSVDRLNGNMVRLTVLDTGRGIDHEKLADLFKPFIRLHEEDEAVEGSGVGLAISQKLVMAMGGDIGVFSEVGEGTRFWIDFPECANDN